MELYYIKGGGGFVSASLRLLAFLQAGDSRLIAKICDMINHCIGQVTQFEEDVGHP